MKQRFWTYVHRRVAVKCRVVTVPKPFSHFEHADDVESIWSISQDAVLVMLRCFSAEGTRTRLRTADQLLQTSKVDASAWWLKGSLKMEQQGAPQSLLQSLLWSGRWGLPAHCRLKHCRAAQAALQASKQEQAQQAQKSIQPAPATKSGIPASTCALSEGLQ